MAKRTQSLGIDPFDPFASERRALEEFQQAVDAFNRKHNKNKHTATRQLKKEGILTRSGKLSKRYGG